jgi:hypothetical protein
LLAVFYLIAGMAVCFMGSKLIGILKFIVPSILSFMIIVIMLSALGFDSVLEEDNETTLTGISKAILGIAICIVIEYRACKIWKDNENYGDIAIAALAGVLPVNVAKGAFTIASTIISRIIQVVASIFGVAFF